MAQPKKGSTLGNYRIEERIGKGGMGVVYRAVHLGLDREVALKLIAEDLSEDEGFRERFRREARIAASIDDPNVIPVFDAGEVEGHLYVAMRLVDGSDLGSLLKKEGRLKPERAARVVDQVAKALDAAHDRRLVHRDVKPGNVLLERKGRGDHVYLTDFGITKGGGGTVGLTRTGDWVGTVDYVAPEQIEGKEIDRRTDVYALGAVLYHSLAGEPPYAKESEVAKIYAHLSKPPPSLKRKLKGVPADLDATIRRAMAKSPKDRYASAGEFGREALAAATGAGGISRATQKAAQKAALEAADARSGEAEAAEPPAKPTRFRRRAASEPAGASGETAAAGRERSLPALKVPRPKLPKLPSRKGDGGPVAEPADRTKAASGGGGGGAWARLRGNRTAALAAGGLLVLGLAAAGYAIGSGSGEQTADDPQVSAGAPASEADPAYAGGVNSAFKALGKSTSASAAALRKADTNDAQADELDQIAAAYGKAAAAIAKLPPPAGAEGASKAIQSALRAERDAYRRMAAAAREGDEQAYARARAAVQRGQVRLTGAVQRLQAAGYAVS